MNINLNKIKTHPFISKVLLMLKGTLISQILGIIGSLFLAKIYAPELYGFYSIFISILTILSMANSFKLEFIIVTEKSDVKSTNIVHALLIIIPIITIFYSLILGLVNSFFLEKKISNLLVLFSVIATLFFSNNKVFEKYATRNSLFKIIASTKIIATSLTIIFQFLFFYIFKDFGLIIGYIISLILTFFYYFFNLNIRFKIPKIDLFKKTVKENINLLKFGFPSGLVNTIAINIIPILLLTYFSVSTVGIYTLSLKIVSIPMLIITNSVSQVYFQKASNLYNFDKSKLYDLTKKIAISNIIIMTIILVLINTVGLYFLTMFFDKDWINMSKYTNILSIYILGQVTFAPISSIIIITNKMQLGLLFNVILLFISLISIYIGSYYNDILLAVKLLSFIGGFSYLFLLFYFLNYLKSFRND